VPIALLLGVLAGWREGSRMDRAVSLGAMIIASTPGFAIAVMLIVVLSVWLRLLPSASAFITENNPFQTPTKLVMPMIVMILSMAGYVARITRASMVQEMRRPYVRTALLKGLTRRRVVFKHVVRNALLAPLTAILIQISFMIGGLVITEMMFAYPGLGTALLQAAMNKDVAVVEGGALLMTFVATSLQLVADLSYLYLNPRIRYSA
jgi:peptide/nickel transport system permease protein